MPLGMGSLAYTLPGADTELEEGSIGRTAEKVGGPFSRHGSIGKHFTTEGNVGKNVEDRGGDKKQGRNIDRTELYGGYTV